MTDEERWAKIDRADTVISCIVGIVGASCLLWLAIGAGIYAFRVVSGGG